jgi:lysozyme
MVRFILKIFNQFSLPTITSISNNCLQLIEYYEAGNNLKKFLKAYKCPAGVCTIGIGTTIYPNGKRVAKGDVITEEEARDFLWHDVRNFQQLVDAFTTDAVTQSQFDALVSFAYNLGTNALKTSTLLKKINANVNDPSIKTEFLKWVNAGGKPLAGLVKRRNAEAWLYFNNELKWF